MVKILKLKEAAIRAKEARPVEHKASNTHCGHSCKAECKS